MANLARKSMEDLFAKLSAVAAEEEELLRRETKLIEERKCAWKAALEQMREEQRASQAEQEKLREHTLELTARSDALQQQLDAAEAQIVQLRAAQEFTPDVSEPPAPPAKPLKEAEARGRSRSRSGSARRSEAGSESESGSQSRSSSRGAESKGRKDKALG